MRSSHHRSLVSITELWLIVDAYTENPFASTHSLDANPFDDPNDTRPSPKASRNDDIERRERELAAREAEIARRETNIKHGKNNFPPCE